MTARIERAEINGAIFSPDRIYRYALWRLTGGPTDTVLGDYCAIVGLNPSTADEKKNDPTIRRDMAFARSWGFTQLVKLNMFGFRSTDPRDLLLQRDPVGPENDLYLEELGRGAGLVVAAWGANARHWEGRVAGIRKMLPNLHYLRLTKDGHPSHTLYLPKTLTPQPWQ